MITETGNLLGHRAIDVLPSEDNVERVVEVSVRTEGTVSVHLLLVAGNGWAEFEGVQFLGKRIGYIELVFDDRSTLRTDLVLGKNIREWAFGNSPDLVKHLDSKTTLPAWISHNSHYRIDTMAIHIPANESARIRELVKIRVVAKFEDDPGKKLPLPAIIINQWC